MCVCLRNLKSDQLGNRKAIFDRKQKKNTHRKEIAANVRKA